MDAPERLGLYDAASVAERWQVVCFLAMTGGAGTRLLGGEGPIFTVIDVVLSVAGIYAVVATILKVHRRRSEASE